VHDPRSRFYVYEEDTGLWRHQSDDATLERLSETFAWLLAEVGAEGLLRSRSASMLKGCGNWQGGSRRPATCSRKARRNPCRERDAGDRE
jgi:hypothetical protein